MFGEAAPMEDTLSSEELHFYVALSAFVRVAERCNGYICIMNS